MSNDGNNKVHCALDQEFQPCACVRTLDAPKSKYYDNHLKKPTDREVLCRARRGTRASMGTGTTLHCDLGQDVPSFLRDPCADSHTLDAPKSKFKLPEKHMGKPMGSEVHWLAL